MRWMLLLEIPLAAAVWSAPASPVAVEFSTRDCLFENVVAFGASVTQGTPRMIPGYGLLVDGVEFYGHRFGAKPIVQGFKSPLRERGMRSVGPSPVEHLLRMQSGRGVAAAAKYVGSYFTRSERDLGSEQVRSMLIKGNNGISLDRASILIGVDAFYWDAIWNTCDYGAGGGAEEMITRLIFMARRQGLPLVLGTVPEENPQNVRIDSDRTGVHGFWYAPDRRCVASLNATLHQY